MSIISVEITIKIDEREMQKTKQKKKTSKDRKEQVEQKL